MDPRLTPTIHDDAEGFTLASPTGPRLQARFLGSKPAAISLERMPDSSRTYQGGHTTHYPGRPYVAVRFSGAQRYGILVGITITSGEQPVIARAGDHADIRVGDATWHRPFGPAVPAAYQPGVSGSLCLYPSGDNDYRAEFSPPKEP